MYFVWPAAPQLAFFMINEELLFCSMLFTQKLKSTYNIDNNRSKSTKHHELTKRINRNIIADKLELNQKENLQE